MSIDEPVPERGPTGPRLAAGIVCGAAAALPGRYMLIATVGAYADILGEGAGLALAADLAPVAVGILVLVVCLVAPTAVGAWLRGCLMVCGISVLLAMTVLQCVGIGWIFGELFDDPMVREAALSGCPVELTPMVGTLALIGAAVFGGAALVIWRSSSRDAMQDY